MVSASLRAVKYGSIKSTAVFLCWRFSQFNQLTDSHQGVLAARGLQGANLCDTVSFRAMASKEGTDFGNAIILPHVERECLYLKYRRLLPSSGQTREVLGAGSVTYCLYNTQYAMITCFENACWLF